MGDGPTVADPATGGARRTMTPERWGEIKAVLAGVLETDASERSATLDRLCHDDGELRREVEALLSFETKADAVLNSVVVPGAALRAETPAPSAIGPYRVLREIGHEIGRASCRERV